MSHLLQGAQQIQQKTNSDGRKVLECFSHALQCSKISLIFPNIMVHQNLFKGASEGFGNEYVQDFGGTLVQF